MLIALNRKQREKQTYKIAEKTTVVILSILSEIRKVEKELGYSLTNDFIRDNSNLQDAYNDESIKIYKEHFKKITKLSSSVYLPFSISELIRHPDIDPVESLVHIYTECEQWLKVNKQVSINAAN